MQLKTHALSNNNMQLILLFIISIFKEKMEAERDTLHEMKTWANLLEHKCSKSVTFIAMTELTHETWSLRSYRPDFFCALFAEVFSQGCDN